MKTSVIIPHRDRDTALARTLRSIRRYWPAGEIIVVDDHSSNPGLVGALCEEFYATLYQLPHEPGERRPFRLSHCRNAGAAMAAGDLLLFNDVDIIHIPGAILRLEDQAAITPGYAVILPELWFLRENGTTDLSRRRIYEALTPAEGWISNHFWLYAWMGWAALPRQLFSAVGGFDQAFWGWACDDMDFAYRAARVGFQFVYTRKAVGQHYPHPDQARKAESGDAARLLFERKHGFPIPCELLPDSGEVVDLTENFKVTK